MATREQVLAAYAANPRAELAPSEEAINYWQNAGLESFNAIVDAVRAENPTLAAQIDAQRSAAATTGGATTGGATTGGATTGGTNAFDQIVTDAYRNIGRTGIGANPNQIDEEGYNYWVNELNTGRLAPSDFNRVFGLAVSNYLQTRPTDPVSQVVGQYKPFATPGLVQTQPRSTGAPATPGYESPGLAGNFANYMGIPIGAQYNPGVTAGGQSPYSQIMAQTPGFTNPYANVVSGLPMGGYNPNIYDPNLLNNFVRQRAAELAAAGMPAPLGFDVGGGGVDAGVSDGGNGIGGNSTAGGMSNSGEGGPDGVGGWAKGGLIDRVAGKNPAGPDDGQINAQVGEYVVKKSSVNKYGKGLLDKINDGKIPASKMKSLLG